MGTESRSPSVEEKTRSLARKFQRMAKATSELDVDEPHVLPLLTNLGR